MNQTACPRCGNAEHHIITSQKVNRFGVRGKKVEKVRCARCGKTTDV